MRRADFLLGGLLAGSNGDGTPASLTPPFARDDVVKECVQLPWAGGFLTLCDRGIAAVVVPPSRLQQSDASLSGAHFWQLSLSPPTDVDLQLPPQCGVVTGGA